MAMPRPDRVAAGTSLSRIDLVYPDPWPNGGTGSDASSKTIALRQIARILRAGGEFRFVTDVPDYAAWTLKCLLRSPGFTWTAERADDWRRPWPGFFWNPYEAKAKREGRVPCYLIFSALTGIATCESRVSSQRANVSLAQPVARAAYLPEPHHSLRGCRR